MEEKNDLQLQDLIETCRIEKIHDANIQGMSISVSDEFVFSSFSYIQNLLL